METLGSRLRQERNRLCLTQAAFAEAGGVAPNAQVNYESGKRCPKADYLQRINGLGADINYIVSGTYASQPDARGVLQTFESAGQPSPAVALEVSMDTQLDRLGEILWMTAATVASVATRTDSNETTRKRMADNLRDFQSESQRFIALACILGHDECELST